MIELVTGNATHNGVVGWQIQIYDTQPFGPRRDDGLPAPQLDEVVALRDAILKRSDRVFPSDTPMKFLKGGLLHV